jgi:hypothetical protein
VYDGRREPPMKPHRRGCSQPPKKSRRAIKQKTASPTRVGKILKAESAGSSVHPFKTLLSIYGAGRRG